MSDDHSIILLPSEEVSDSDIRCSLQFFYHPESGLPCIRLKNHRDGSMEPIMLYASAITSLISKHSAELTDIVKTYLEDVDAKTSFNLH